jgi:hypothetical protein
MVASNHPAAVSLDHAIRWWAISLQMDDGWWRFLSDDPVSWQQSR